MQSDRWLSFLGIIRKAGKITVGEEKTGCAARQNKASLIILAEDASPNAVKRAEQYARIGKCGLLMVPADKCSLGDALGAAPFAMAAICDDGLATAFQNIINHCD